MGILARISCKCAQRKICTKTCKVASSRLAKNESSQNIVTGKWISVEHYAAENKQWTTGIGINIDCTVLGKKRASCRRITTVQCHLYKVQNQYILSWCTYRLQTVRKATEGWSNQAEGGSPTTPASWCSRLCDSSPERGACNLLLTNGIWRGRRDVSHDHLTSRKPLSC